jgi:hypothetical protein
MSTILKLLPEGVMIMDSNAKQIKFVNEAVYKIILNSMSRSEPSEGHSELNRGLADTEEINK